MVFWLLGFVVDLTIYLLYGAEYFIKTLALLIAAFIPAGYPRSAVTVHINRPFHSVTAVLLLELHQ